MLKKKIYYFAMFFSVLEGALPKKLFFFGKMFYYSFLTFIKKKRLIHDFYPKNALMLSQKGNLTVKHIKNCIHFSFCCKKF